MILPMVLPQFALSQMPSTGGMNGPIDVQAGEQDFEGDHVVAKGSVRVTYKDSVIVAPMATLYKDENGAMQRAVFTGRPHLTQTTSRVDADVLTFEMATQTVIAEGNAHSEVISKSGDDGSGKAESIVTDSDRQEYDRNSGKFVANGHVRVLHGDIFAKADKLNLVYGQDNKPETAIFTGNAQATQRQNSTKADTITYFLKTQRLQATGHVQSRVIQKKAQADLKAVPAQQASATALDSPAHAAATKVANDVITIYSDSQDMSQDTGRITADGNVRMFYQDTSGIGPKMIISRSKEGKPEKIFFVGRSQIRQPGKSWIADRITFTCADKKVLAIGNSRAFILRPGEAPPPVESQLATQTIPSPM